MYDFDRPCDRRHWDEIKWSFCKEDEIPMWIADMDFETAPPILDIFAERLKHHYFGYNSLGRRVKSVIAEHYRTTYGCEMEEDWLVYIPSVMPGVNVGCLVAGGTIMYCEPMYMHIREVAHETGLPELKVPLKHENGCWSFDFEAMEKAITPDVKSFILCSPHNPVGRLFSREEISQLVDFCKRHDLLLVSDEIHCELALHGQHTPLFSVCSENTVTLSSIGKICNVPGVAQGFAIIPDAELREKYIAQIKGLFPTDGTTFGVLAIEKAFDGSCDRWKAELIDYLRGNQALLEERIANMPLLSVNHNEATYLAWIDCRELGVESPSKFFREKAKVFMNDGDSFGTPGYVRLNFACPRAQLTEALDRIEKAVTELAAGK